MKDETRAKALRVVLIVTGVIFCLAAPMILVPASWMRGGAVWFFRLFGVEGVEETWPPGALYGYAIRVSLVAYAWIGATFLLAARDPVKHRALVDLSIAGLLLLFVTCLGAGLASSAPPAGGVPAMWYLGDAIPALVGGVLLLILRPRRAEG